MERNMYGQQMPDDFGDYGWEGPEAQIDWVEQLDGMHDSNYPSTGLADHVPPIHHMTMGEDDPTSTYGGRIIPLDKQ